MRLVIIWLVFLLIGCNPGTRNETTFLSVKEIREIGELITAEYHGEVIRSLRDVYIESDSIKFRKAYLRFKATYDSIRTRRKIPRFALNEFERTGLMLSEEYIFLKKASKRDWHVRFLEDEIHQRSWEDFYSEHKEVIDKKSIKKRKKIDLVYIARGSVNAGFDLSLLGTLVIPIRSSDTLYLRNMDPIILDATINPWYSRDRKIPGFEIIKSKNEGDISYDEITLLKREMKQDLVGQAISRDIYQLALNSGQKALIGLFIKPNQESIKHLVIVPSKYFEQKIDILMDHKIDDEELTELNELPEFIKKDSVSFDTSWFSSKPQEQYYLKLLLDELFLQTATNLNADGWDAWYQEKVRELSM